MTNALRDLLPQRKFEEPPEIQIIKQFMQENYQQTPEITVQPKQIIIQVKGSALAGTLRMRLHELQQLLQTDKRLVIRIGQ